MTPDPYDAARRVWRRLARVDGALLVYVERSVAGLRVATAKSAGRKHISARAIVGTFDHRATPAELEDAIRVVIVDLGGFSRF